MRVIVGLVTWTFVEIGLYVWVGGLIGVWATWGVVLGSALLGVWVLRGQRLGRRLGAVRAEDMLGPLAHGVLRMLAGVLLILPGFLTDVIGLCLLVPGIREVVIARLRARLGVRVSEVYEGTAVEILPERLDKPSGWTRR